MLSPLVQAIWQSDYATITVHLGGALLAGSLIGLERSYHGRAAGFRTHTLVCLASSLLMLVTLFQWSWLPGIPMETVRTDPTRMAQGIMTGVGFYFPAPHPAWPTPCAGFPPCANSASRPPATETRSAHPRTQAGTPFAAGGRCRVRAYVETRYLYPLNSQII